MAFPPALAAIVDRLAAHDTHTSATLSDALNRDIALDDLAAWARFDSTNYVRNLVARTDNWELRLLCWRPGQSTSLHGHARAACAFRIVRGSAVESVLGERDRTWTPGAVVEESRANIVHQVSNPGPDALLTLHAYSPALPIDAQSTADGRNVVIIGGGASGAALAYHLLRLGGAELRITMIERGPWLGRGIAYGVDSPHFRLNVPASRMSLDPARPDDFVQWAGSHEAPNAFLGRAAYGAYVVDSLARVIRESPGKLRVLRGNALAIETNGVRLGDGRLIPAERVVLATGIAPRIASGWMASDGRIIDAWDECGLAALPPSGRLLVLGTGLSGLDVLTLLLARNFDGRVTVVSRRGLLPRPHLASSAAPRSLSNDEVASAPSTLRGLLHWGRAVVRESVARDEPWQVAIDAIRPHVPRLWQSMSPNDRARFVRRVRAHWDVLRHRAPLESLHSVDVWRERGALEILAGHVVSCEPSDEGLDVVLRTRDGAIRPERYDAIVRCIGPALEHIDSESSLIASLIASGEAFRDPAGLGVVTDDDGRLVDANGRASSKYFALGAMRRASNWESTAIPEIARDAAALARTLLD